MSKGAFPARNINPKFRDNYDAIFGRKKPGKTNGTRPAGPAVRTVCGHRGTRYVATAEGVRPADPGAGSQ